MSCCWKLDIFHKIKDFGKKVKHYRNLIGYTQEELANKIGVHQTYIGKLEIGKINPSTKKLFQISRALGVKLSNIFDFD